MAHKSRAGDLLDLEGTRLLQDHEDGVADPPRYYDVPEMPERAEDKTRIIYNGTIVSLASAVLAFLLRIVCSVPSYWGRFYAGPSPDFYTLGHGINALAPAMAVVSALNLRRMRCTGRSFSTPLNMIGDIAVVWRIMNTALMSLDGSIMQVFQALRGEGYFYVRPNDVYLARLWNRWFVIANLSFIMAALVFAGTHLALAVARFVRLYKTNNALRDFITGERRQFGFEVKVKIHRS